MRKGMWRRRLSGSLAVLTLLSGVLPYLPPLPAQADVRPGDTMLSQGEGWDHYCIDSFELLGEQGGILGQYEWYQYVLPSTRLSDEDTARLFWAMVSFYYGMGKDGAVSAAVEKINSQAAALGIAGIAKNVTEEDLKKVLHSASTRKKYAWLDDAVRNADRYLTAAGLLSGTAAGALVVGVGGKTVPAILSGHTDTATALRLGPGEFVVEFDAGGADADFIRTVPLEFSADGGTWGTVPTGGWTCLKTDTAVQFSNPDPKPPKLWIRFRPEGTAYAVGGSFGSARDVYDACLQLWVCVACNNAHVVHPKTSPLDWHQRMARLELSDVPCSYYAVIEGENNVSEEGNLAFRIYRHEEQMDSHYQVQLYKYDHETGNALEGAGFALYECFDDRDQIDTDRDGAEHLYEGGEPYQSYSTDNPVTWEGFRRVDSMVTDEEGHARKTVQHGYHYDKTFCDGHPAPRFVPVPEEEIEEYEDAGGETIVNAAEIAAAQAENQRLGTAWLDCAEACETYASDAFDGVHFHWVMQEVDRSAIEEAADGGGEPGTTPDGGQTSSADSAESYAQSGCKADCEATYEKFTALHYSYALVEIKARDGYVLHGIHADDIPVEVITTDSSEHGANADFANLYGRDIVVSQETGQAAEHLMAERAAAASYRLAAEEKPEEEQPRVTLVQKIGRYLQRAVALFSGKKEDDDEIPLVDDRATPADIAEPDGSAEGSAADACGRASDSDAEERASDSDARERASGSDAVELATQSNALLRVQFATQKENRAADSSRTAGAGNGGQAFSAVGGSRTADSGNGGDGSRLFEDRYNTALSSASVGEANIPGDADRFSHCSDADGEGDAWRIYDHRTEGELHINKRDLQLQDGEKEGKKYSSYGDTQGDGTLEGAVYGLFAAEDIVHPDGRTGVVYRANNLVAVAATDKNGDASFLTCTEAPGMSYDYAAGKITETADGWAKHAPQNLYAEECSCNDYTGDGSYTTETGMSERTYQDYGQLNGNCWIGRPLILGSYYVRELTRSEGYELSVGNRRHPLTNRGQELEVSVPQGEGYVSVTAALRAEGQISAAPTGAYGDPDINELFFSVQSGGTGEKGFDLVFHALPDGTRLYRRETGTKTIWAEVGTGEYEAVPLVNDDGSPRYVAAENDRQYPKYDADGSMQTVEVPVNAKARWYPAAAEEGLDADRTQEALTAAEPEMDADAVAARLAAEFSPADFLFVKGKTERALRGSGKSTPRSGRESTLRSGGEDMLRSGGKSTSYASAGDNMYSGVSAGVFDTGVREGELDVSGVSGVRPGEPAAETVYGCPVRVLRIPKEKEDGSALLVGDLILSVLDYYNSHACFSYGGVDAVDEDGDSYLVAVYTGLAGGGTRFFVPGAEPESDAVFYKAIEYLPDETAKCPRRIWAVYTADGSGGDEEPFGAWEAITVREVGGDMFADATLVTDARASGRGELVTKTAAENVYYQAGETPLDADGNPIQAWEYREKTVVREQEAEDNRWMEIPMTADGGTAVAHIDSSYTDQFGAAHEDSRGQSYEFRLVLPERELVLSAADVAALGEHTAWRAGDTMAASAYYLQVKKLGVRACLDRNSQNVTGENSYVKEARLAYPGQDYVWQDGEGTPGTNTRTAPVGVQERSIRQQVKVTKDTEGGALDNFRFKIYLKSNLERLYRDESGGIVWQDRHGNALTDGSGTGGVLAEAEAFPERVRKIYTRVRHRTSPLYQDARDAIVANTELYGKTGGLINGEQNGGYTAVLETTERLTADGSGARTVKAPNYEKFFDAVAVANHDKWDDAAPTYTSWRPLGNLANRTPEAVENARVSDAVRQFAIDWYLEDEVKKLVKKVPGTAETEAAGGALAYMDELHDAALRAAVEKAENYLKPFFAYDLDEIYAVAWDSAAGGGSDGDFTTLSADTLHEDADGTGGAQGAAGENGSHYDGMSVYLPYGTYVVVEQQPQYALLRDFRNKHYEADRPKEVSIPALYGSEAGAGSAGCGTGTTDSDYHYNAAFSAVELERRYRIRFLEENRVIQAHGGSGDFEVYPYGMDMDRIANGVPAQVGAGDYFALTQSEYRPYQNHYNDEDDRTAGEVPYYLTEGQSGRRGVSAIYRYSSISEQAGTADDVAYPGGTAAQDNDTGVVYRDRVAVMHGVQTAYDGKYAPMLVPWSVPAPTGEADGGTSGSGGSARTGAADGSASGFAGVRFRNRLYKAKLRLEKLDAETHENLLHDGAVFALYAAKRDESEDGDGRVLFYEEETTVFGTESFLRSMGATEIRPMARSRSLVRRFLDFLTGREPGVGELFTGVVPAGTPICDEADKIVLGDGQGQQTVAFESSSTILDGTMRAEETDTGAAWQLQTVGYLETPQPLGAGAYVIAEEKAPAGYVPSRPVALEIYSDKVTYYKEGNRDSRVLAAVYEYDDDRQTAGGTEPPDTVGTARVNIENEPVKLTVEKLKETSAGAANTTADKTVTYKVSGRIDGSLTQIGGDPDLVYAFENGRYLGYAWRKGTLEMLAARKAAGEAALAAGDPSAEQVELAFEGHVFAGYGYVTRRLGTADDANAYVAGATMALFDAIPLNPSGDTEDHAYEGLVVERNAAGNVTRMYVQEGYAGEKTEFLPRRDEDGTLIVTEYPTGVDAQGQPVTAVGNVWAATNVKRRDTDILYYDLDDLDVLVTERVDGQSVTYGYDRSHTKVPVAVLEADKANIARTDSDHALFAFKGGVPYLEIVGGDFTKLAYSARDQVLTVDADTAVYHLGRDGSRDARVDPYTGMAYVPVEETDRDADPADGKEAAAKAGDGDRKGGRNDGSTGQPAAQVLVWAVHVRRDADGTVIARDKITTSRAATVGENAEGYQEDVVLEVKNDSGKEISDGDKPSYRHGESGYVTGSWHADGSGESHRESTIIANRSGQSRNGEILTDDNNGSFAKELNPVLDRYGLPIYYRRSGETYDKGTELYDRNDDFVRYQDSDNLESYNHNAYHINGHDELYDGDEAREKQEQKKLWHRQGEAYILENVWVTSERTPNDPFTDEMTDGQADILKRVPAGYYIMEELAAPAGYLRGMPAAVTVRETAQMQAVSMVDRTTKIEIAKVDGAGGGAVKRLNMESGLTAGTVQEGVGDCSYALVPGAEIALFAAEKVYTADTAAHPKGYYLKKTGTEPVRFCTTSGTAGNPVLTEARWTTGTQPVYIEGIPVGSYVLEELVTPAGFVKAKPLEVEVVGTPEVQTFVLYNDHTKVEIEKYFRDAQARDEEKLLAGAEFTLYPARTDADGAVLYEDGKPLYDAGRPLDSFVTPDREVLQAFIPAFEEMYRSYGTQPGTSVSWAAGGKLFRAFYESGWQIDAAGFSGTIDGGMTDGPADTAVFGGQKTRFPARAVLVFCTENGGRIRISVYGGNGDGGERDFTFEYQFGYRRLPEVNGYAAGYFTPEGRCRLDYLPIGASYVLVETGVPDGYAKGGDTVIVVRDTADVQTWRIENTEGMLMISKVLTTSGSIPFPFSGELPGARLALYRAGANGELIMDDAHRVDDWISGGDGVYSELDFVNGRIPDGYQQGDRKPHTIRRLADGTYWLAEPASPAYLTTFVPVKIEYRQEDEVRIVRVSDVPAQGELTVRKTDADGRPLAGAVFELTAYRAGEMRTPVLVRTLADGGDSLTVTGLPVGEVQADGSISPYTYRLRETVPPKGCAVSTQIYRWQFAPDRQGVSYAFGEPAKHTLTVADERTRVVIGKKALGASVGGGDTDPYVAGARLALYEVTGRDGQDGLLYDEENPFAVWTTEQEATVIEGLIAGHTYLLKELTVPAGYHRMKPVVFTVATDGRSIAAVTDNCNTVTVQMRTKEQIDPDTGETEERPEIAAVTLRGRYAVDVSYRLTDENGSVAAQFPGTGGDVFLQLPEELRGRYMLTETTRYSDGSEAATARIVRPLVCDADGVCRIPTRTVARVTLAMERADGGQIGSFAVSQYTPEHTVVNDGTHGGAWLQVGEDCVLIERTFYTDGTELETNRLRFSLTEGAVAGIVALDQRTRAVLSKQAITGSGELPGCEMELRDADGNLVDAWISGEEPHEIIGVLTAGEWYVLAEKRPAPGYTCAEEIAFQMSEDGVPVQVTMLDQPTRVEVRKVSAPSGLPLSGAKLQILDGDGKICEEWISDGEVYRIEGSLEAGEQYFLHEAAAPRGYLPAGDVEFCVPADGSVLTLTLENRRRPTPGTDTPEKPQPPKPLRVGRIFTAYTAQRGWSGRQRFGTDRPRLTWKQTGDERRTAVCAVLAAVALLGLAVVSLAGKKKNRSCRKKLL